MRPFDRSRPGICRAPAHCGPPVRRVGVEVFPAQADAYFLDERYTDPIDKQIRFEATAYNSRLGVGWQVRSVSGGPGAGAIDATGLYTAPVKGALASGTTDLVIATSVEDPLSKAYAWVTLVGRGPEPAPEPGIEVFPRRVNLYYRNNPADPNDPNRYIDESNKLQMFRAEVRHVTAPSIEWLIDGNVVPVVPPPQPNVAPPWFLYQADVGPGPSPRTVVVHARLAATPSVIAQAQVVLLNYSWPAL